MFELYKDDKHFVNDNRIELLENGDEFFPRLIQRIQDAQKEIFIETFILANDRVGKELQQALIEAAKRGVWVAVTTDSFGSYFLDEDYIKKMTDAGIVFQIFEPQPGWIKKRPKVYHRLHRKLAIIDGQYALIGGINLCEDHLMDYGPTGKQDYAAEIEGPVVWTIRQNCKTFVKTADDTHLGELLQSARSRGAVGDASIALLTRDNRHHRSDIEKGYLLGIRKAQKRIYIANAYFFPSFRFLHALRRAAKRGVEVVLILQGDPDIPLALRAARCLYDHLAGDGVKVYEFLERPLHAKIALIDDDWSTIGSSNLEPLSLGLNLEANVVVIDRQFNQDLYKKMKKLLAHSKLIENRWLRQRRWFHLIENFLAYHVMRKWPSLIKWLPSRPPKIEQVAEHLDDEEEPLQKQTT